MVQGRQLSIVLIVPVFFLLWLLYGGNYWNGDRDAYELYYERENLASWGLEFGYGYLNLISNRLRLGYQTFQILISLATILLYLRYFLKLSNAPLLSFLFYAVAFFPLDYVLMRQSLAFAVTLQAFVLLFENCKYSRIKFLLIIFLAASIHQSSFFFLIFCFMPRRKVFSLWKFVSVFVVVVFFYFFLRLKVPLPDSIQTHFDTYSISLKSALLNLTFHFLSVALVFFSVFSEKRHILRCIASNAREAELVFILNLNLISCFWVVLYFEAEIFVRLLRCLVFFNVFYALGSLALRLKSNYLNLIITAFFALYLIAYFILPVISFTVAPLFNRNLLFNLFGQNIWQDVIFIAVK